MGQYEKPLRKNSGAVSVLAIFMMLVLVTLGAFAITSARVNYIFSVRALEWNQMYYALEGQAERYIRDIDHLLIEAGTSVIGYVDTESYAEVFISAAWDLLSGHDYPEADIYMIDGKLYTMRNFTSDTNENANLRVVLRINGDPDDPRRFIVHEWVQWQKLDDFGGMEVWDGFF